MANWYVKNREDEIGPVSAAKLKSMVNEGKIAADTNVRREDMPNWVLARNVKGLLPLSPPAIDKQLNNSSPQTAGSETAPSHETAASRLVGGMKTAALIAGKEAQLKKLEWDQAAADEVAGAKAYAGKLGEGENAAKFSRMREIENTVSKLKQPELAVEGESTREKAGRLGTEAKKKIQIESLLMERKRTIRAIGEHFRALPIEGVPETLHEEVERARKVQEKRDALSSEIAKLDSPIKGVVEKLKKYSKVAIAAGILLIGGFLAIKFFGGSGSSQVAYPSLDIGGPQQDAFAAMQREAELETERIQAEIAAIADQTERETAERNATKKIEDQQRQLEIAKRKVDAERKAREADAAAAEKRKREMADSAERSISAQREREKLSERLFGAITLPPEGVHLSNTLRQKHNATVELRGKGYDSISALHAKRDWLGLINAVSGQSYTELPSASAIESAAEGLASNSFQMLVKTQSVFDSGDGGPSLQLISFPIDYSYRVASVVNYAWSRHPDAIGYYTSWSPSSGYSIVVYANQDAVSNFMGKLISRYENKRSEVLAREHLGEIDSSSASIDLTALRSKFYDEAVAWAKGQ